MTTAAPMGGSVSLIAQGTLVVRAGNLISVARTATRLTRHSFAALQWVKRAGAGSNPGPLLVLDRCSPDAGERPDGCELRFSSSEVRSQEGDRERAAIVLRSQTHQLRYRDGAISQ